MAARIAFTGVVGGRHFSTTPALKGARNFRKFPLYNFRGSPEFRKLQREGKNPLIPYYTYGERQPGYSKDGKFYYVPEMEPDLIVPDLTNFPLKPYVSYKANTGIEKEEFTAKDLFLAVYGEKIRNDFINGKLDEKGNPLEPSQNEKLTPKEATLLARQTGSDIF